MTKSSGSCYLRCIHVSVSYLLSIRSIPRISVQPVKLAMLSALTCSGALQTAHKFVNHNSFHNDVFSVTYRQLVFSRSGPNLARSLLTHLDDHEMALQRDRTMQWPGLTFDFFRQSLKTHLFGDRST